jgi:uncharacterized protein
MKKKRLFDTVESEKRPSAFRMQGKKIKCPHCGNKIFEIQSKLLNTAGLTFLSLDWANKQASILICTRCSGIQWFLKQPEAVK